MKFELDKDFEKNLKDISKPQEVELQNLLTNKYLSENTTFTSFDEFINELGINTVEEFENFPAEKLDTFIKNHSSLQSWQDLLDGAATEYFISKLGL